ncbi:cysteine hydrolase family protein [Sorangium sp. So ce1335]|uniref:cysteine hydrolase family protein n=1 Tax=Sorangium sp. So ce1335 TaxID=3133335 RepID=UPI003F62D8D2
MTPRIRPLPLDKIHPESTALLVIDMERDFVDEGAPGETPGARGLVPVINRLIGWARRWQLPILLTHEMHRPDRSDYGIELEFDPVHCLEGTRGCELTDGLSVAPGDYRIVAKRRYDCFLGTDLDLLLRCKRIENLVCCGVSTNVCVMSTVLTARNLDYRVLLPADAVAGISAAHHEAALLCMSDVFAYITSSAEVTQLWERRSPEAPVSRRGPREAGA